MKQSLKLVLSAVTIGLVVPAYGILRGRSFFNYRSQSVHAERELVGWQESINLFALGVNYGSVTLMPLYSHTTQPAALAEYFFGTSCLTVSGSRAPDRGEDDILADYLGLPLDFKSTLSFRPNIQNIVFDLNSYFGLDAWVTGLYIRMHAPLVHTTWNMNMCERIIDPGSQSYPAGYMANGVVVRNAQMFTAKEYFSGMKQVGDIEPLKFGKMNCGCSHTGLSDVQVVLGWNFINNDDYHFGANLRTSVPTGNHSNGLYLFEPIVGNGGFWEFGAGLTGHTILWDSENGNHSLALYGDLNMTHLFTTCQRRSLDLRNNGSLSRYVLIQDIGTPIVQGLQVDDVPAQQQYHGRLMPAINKTTLPIAVSIGLQADLVIKIAYIYKNFSFDLGYDLWGRTSEQFHGRECFPASSYAIKGDAQVYGFHEDTGRFVALNATQHDATIHAGQGDGNANHEFTNANADNSKSSGGTQLFATFDLDGTDTLNQAFGTPQAVSGSLQSILLTDCDLDNLSGLAPAALAQSLFIHFNYAWEESDTAIPFVGFGSEITFDGTSTKKRSAANEWAVWLKGGVAY
jgi:hypothetical protein